MAYFLTGGTGFIGGALIKELLKRNDETIYCLVREGSTAKLDSLREKLNAPEGRIVGIAGDLTQKELGVSDADKAMLKGKITAAYHLAAVYDISNHDLDFQTKVNIDGTTNMIRFCEAIEAGCLNHVSSIAAAGLFNGYWREDMFEEAENYDEPYFKTKHESEGVVRNDCNIPYRIYRPAIVLGDSKTGEIDKIDGPYYFFKMIQKIRRMIPRWVPTIGIEGSRINMVPVDFVVRAIDHLSHKEGLDGRCFHLTDPEPYRAGEILNIFADAGHAPRFTMRIDTRMFAFIPLGVRNTLASLPPVKKIINLVLGDLGIPRDVLKLITYPTRFDNRDCLKELEGTDIAVPRLEDYAPKIWDYWERNLDPDLFKDRTLSGAVRGKHVMITGASSGIGEATAMKLAKAGAVTILVARTPEKLEDTKTRIEKLGGVAHIYPCDVSDMESIDSLVDRVIGDLGHVDILVNNAGRSIRRSLELSYDRFHDFERTIQLNYFGAIRLIMRLMPHMVKQQEGQIINISSIGVLARPARFSAYVASKAALEGFSDCVQPELLDKGITMTTINMPLVRTPMISPTKMYDHVPTLSPDQAAGLVAKGIMEKSSRIATRLGLFGAVIHAIAPKLGNIVQNTSYKLFPDSSAAKGEEGGKEKAPTPEAIAFATVMQGVHW